MLECKTFDCPIPSKPEEAAHLWEYRVRAHVEEDGDGIPRITEIHAVGQMFDNSPCYALPAAAGVRNLRFVPGAPGHPAWNRQRGKMNTVTVEDYVHGSGYVEAWMQTFHAPFACPTIPAPGTQELWSAAFHDFVKAALPGIITAYIAPRETALAGMRARCDKFALPLHATVKANGYKEVRGVAHD